MKRQRPLNNDATHCASLSDDDPGQSYQALCSYLLHDSSSSSLSGDEGCNRNINKGKTSPITNIAGKWEAVEIRYINNGPSPDPGSQSNNLKSRIASSHADSRDRLHKQTVKVEKVVISPLLSVPRQVCGELGTSRRCKYTPRAIERGMADWHSDSESIDSTKTSTKYTDPSLKCRKMLSSYSRHLPTYNSFDGTVMLGSSARSLSPANKKRITENTINEYRQVALNILLERKKADDRRANEQVKKSMNETVLEQSNSSSQTCNVSKIQHYGSVVNVSSKHNDVVDKVKSQITKHRNRLISSKGNFIKPRGKQNKMKTTSSEAKTNIFKRNIKKENKSVEKIPSSSNGSDRQNFLWYKLSEEKDVFNEEQTEKIEDQQSEHRSSSSNTLHQTSVEQSMPIRRQSMELNDVKLVPILKLPLTSPTQPRRYPNQKRNNISPVLLSLTQTQRIPKVSESSNNGSLDQFMSNKENGYYITEQKQNSATVLHDHKLSQHYTSLGPVNYNTPTIRRKSPTENSVRFKDIPQENYTKELKTNPSCAESQQEELLLHSILKSPTAKAVQALCSFYQNNEGTSQSSVVNESDISVQEILEAYQTLFLGAIDKSEMKSRGGISERGIKDISTCDEMSEITSSPISKLIGRKGFLREIIAPVTASPSRSYPTRKRKSNSITTLSEKLKPGNHDSFQPIQKGYSISNSSFASSSISYTQPSARVTTSTLSPIRMNNMWSNRVRNGRSAAMQQRSETSFRYQYNVREMEKNRYLSKMGFRRENSYSKIHMKRLREYIKQYSAPSESHDFFRCPSLKRRKEKKLITCLLTKSQIEKSQFAKMSKSVESVSVTICNEKKPNEGSPTIVLRVTEDAMIRENEDKLPNELSPMSRKLWKGQIQEMKKNVQKCKTESCHSLSRHSQDVVSNVDDIDLSGSVLDKSESILNVEKSDENMIAMKQSFENIINPSLSAPKQHQNEATIESQNILEYLQITSKSDGLENTALYKLHDKGTDQRSMLSYCCQKDSESNDTTKLVSVESSITQTDQLLSIGNHTMKNNGKEQSKDQSPQANEPEVIDTISSVTSTDKQCQYIPETGHKDELKTQKSDINPTESAPSGDDVVNKTTGLKVCKSICHPRENENCLVKSNSETSEVREASDGPSSANFREKTVMNVVEYYSKLKQVIREEPVDISPSHEANKLGKGQYIGTGKVVNDNVSMASCHDQTSEWNETFGSSLEVSCSLNDRDHEFHKASQLGLINANAFLKVHKLNESQTSKLETNDNGMQLINELNSQDNANKSDSTNSAGKLNTNHSKPCPTQKECGFGQSENITNSISLNNEVDDRLAKIGYCEPVEDKNLNVIHHRITSVENDTTRKGVSENIQRLVDYPSGSDENTHSKKVSVSRLHNINTPENLRDLHTTHSACTFLSILNSPPINITGTQRKTDDNAQNEAEKEKSRQSNLISQSCDTYFLNDERVKNECSTVSKDQQQEISSVKKQFDKITNVNNYTCCKDVSKSDDNTFNIKRFSIGEGDVTRQSDDVAERSNICFEFSSAKDKQSFDKLKKRLSAARKKRPTPIVLSNTCSKNRVYQEESPNCVYHHKVVSVKSLVEVNDLSYNMTYSCSKNNYSTSNCVEFDDDGQTPIIENQYYVHDDDNNTENGVRPNTQNSDLIWQDDPFSNRATRRSIIQCSPPGQGSIFVRRPIPFRAMTSSNCTGCCSHEESLSVKHPLNEQTNNSIQQCDSSIENLPQLNTKQSECKNMPTTFYEMLQMIISDYRNKVRNNKIAIQTQAANELMEQQRITTEVNDSPTSLPGQDIGRGSLLVGELNTKFSSETSYYCGHVNAENAEKVNQYTKPHKKRNPKPSSFFDDELGDTMCFLSSNSGISDTRVELTEPHSIKDSVKKSGPGDIASHSDDDSGAWEGGDEVHTLLTLIRPLDEGKMHFAIEQHNHMPMTNNKCTIVYDYKVNTSPTDDQFIISPPLEFRTPSNGGREFECTSDDTHPSSIEPSSTQFPAAKQPFLEEQQCGNSHEINVKYFEAKPSNLVEYVTYSNGKADLFESKMQTQKHQANVEKDGDCFLDDDRKYNLKPESGFSFCGQTSKRTNRDKSSSKTNQSRKSEESSQNDLMHVLENPTKEISSISNVASFINHKNTNEESVNWIYNKHENDRGMVTGVNTEDDECTGSTVRNLGISKCTERQRNNDSPNRRSTGAQTNNESKPNKSIDKILTINDKSITIDCKFRQDVQAEIIAAVGSLISDAVLVGKSTTKDKGGLGDGVGNDMMTNKEMGNNSPISKNEMNTIIHVKAGTDKCSSGENGAGCVVNSGTLKYEHLVCNFRGIEDENIANESQIWDMRSKNSSIPTNGFPSEIVLNSDVQDVRIVNRNMFEKRKTREIHREDPGLNKQQHNGCDAKKSVKEPFWVKDFVKRKNFNHIFDKRSHFNQASGFVQNSVRNKGSEVCVVRSDTAIIGCDFGYELEDEGEYLWDESDEEYERDTKFEKNETQRTCYDKCIGRANKNKDCILENGHTIDADQQGSKKICLNEETSKEWDCLNGPCHNKPDTSANQYVCGNVVGENSKVHGVPCKQESQESTENKKHPDLMMNPIRSSVCTNKLVGISQDNGCAYENNMKEHQPAFDRADGLSTKRNVQFSDQKWNCQNKATCAAVNSGFANCNAHGCFRKVHDENATYDSPCTCESKILDDTVNITTSAGGCNDYENIKDERRIGECCDEVHFDNNLENRHISKGNGPLCNIGGDERICCGDSSRRTRVIDPFEVLEGDIDDSRKDAARKTCTNCIEYTRDKNVKVENEEFDIDRTNIEVRNCHENDKIQKITIRMSERTPSARISKNGNIHSQVKHKDLEETKNFGMDTNFMESGSIVSGIGGFKMVRSQIEQEQTNGVSGFKNTCTGCEINAGSSNSVPSMNGNEKREMLICEREMIDEEIHLCKDIKDINICGNEIICDRVDNQFNTLNNQIETEGGREIHLPGEWLEKKNAEIDCKKGKVICPPLQRNVSIDADDLISNHPIGSSGINKRQIYGFNYNIECTKNDLIISQSYEGTTLRGIAFSDCNCLQGNGPETAESISTIPGTCTVAGSSQASKESKHNQLEMPSKGDHDPSSNFEEFSFAQIPYYNIFPQNYHLRSIDDCSQEAVTKGCFEEAPSNFKKETIQTLATSVSDDLVRQFIDVFTSRFLSSTLTALNKCEGKSVSNSGSVQKVDIQAKYDKTDCDIDSTRDNVDSTNQKLNHCNTKENEILGHEFISEPTFQKSNIEKIGEEPVPVPFPKIDEPDNPHHVLSDKQISMHASSHCVPLMGSSLLSGKSEFNNDIENKEALATDNSKNENQQIFFSSSYSSTPDKSIAEQMKRNEISEHIVSSITFDIQAYFKHLTDTLNQSISPAVKNSSHETLFIRHDSPPRKNAVKDKYILSAVSQEIRRYTYIKPNGEYSYIYLDDVSSPEKIAFPSKSLSDIHLHQRGNIKYSRETCKRHEKPTKTFLNGCQCYRRDFFLNIDEDRERIRTTREARHFSSREPTKGSLQTKQQTFNVQRVGNRSLIKKRQTFAHPNITAYKTLSDYQLDTFDELGSLQTELQSSLATTDTVSSSSQSSVFELYNEKSNPLPQSPICGKTYLKENCPDSILKSVRKSKPIHSCNCPHCGLAVALSSVKLTKGVRGESSVGLSENSINKKNNIPSIEKNVIHEMHVDNENNPSNEMYFNEFMSQCRNDITSEVVQQTVQYMISISLLKFMQDMMCASRMVYPEWATNIKSCTPTPEDISLNESNDQENARQTCVNENIGTADTKVTDRCVIIECQSGQSDGYSSDKKETRCSTVPGSASFVEQIESIAYDCSADVLIHSRMPNVIETDKTHKRDNKFNEIDPGKNIDPKDDDKQFITPISQCTSKNDNTEYIVNNSMVGVTDDHLNLVVKDNHTLHIPNNDYFSCLRNGSNTINPKNSLTSICKSIAENRSSFVDVQSENISDKNEIINESYVGHTNLGVGIDVMKQEHVELEEGVKTNNNPFKATRSTIEMIVVKSHERKEDSGRKRDNIDIKHMVSNCSPKRHSLRHVKKINERPNTSRSLPPTPFPEPIQTNMNLDHFETSGNKSKKHSINNLGGPKDEFDTYIFRLSNILSDMREKFDGLLVNKNPSENLTPSEGSKIETCGVHAGEIQIQERTSSHTNLESTAVESNKGCSVCMICSDETEHNQSKSIRKETINRIDNNVSHSTSGVSNMLPTKEGDSKIDSKLITDQKSVIIERESTVPELISMNRCEKQAVSNVDVISMNRGKKQAVSNDNTPVLNLNSVDGEKNNAVNSADCVTIKRNEVIIKGSEEPYLNRTTDFLNKYRKYSNITNTPTAIKNTRQPVYIKPSCRYNMLDEKTQDDSTRESIAKGSLCDKTERKRADDTTGGIILDQSVIKSVSEIGKPDSKGINNGIPLQMPQIDGLSRELLSTDAKNRPLENNVNLQLKTNQTIQESKRSHSFLVFGDAEKFITSNSRKENARSLFCRFDTSQSVNSSINEDASRVAVGTQFPPVNSILGEKDSSQSLKNADFGSQFPSVVCSNSIQNTQTRDYTFDPPKKDKIQQAIDSTTTRTSNLNEQQPVAKPRINSPINPKPFSKRSFGYRSPTLMNVNILAEDTKNCVDLTVEEKKKNNCFSLIKRQNWEQKNPECGEFDVETKGKIRETYEKYKPVLGETDQNSFTKPGTDKKYPFPTDGGSKRNSEYTTLSESTTNACGFIRANPTLSGLSNTESPLVKSVTQASRRILRRNRHKKFLLRSRHLFEDEENESSNWIKLNGIDERLCCSSGAGLVDSERKINIESNATENLSLSNDSLISIKIRVDENKTSESHSSVNDWCREPGVFIGNMNDLRLDSSNTEVNDSKSGIIQSEETINPFPQKSPKRTLISSPKKNQFFDGFIKVRDSSSVHDNKSSHEIHTSPVIGFNVHKIAFRDINCITNEKNIFHKEFIKMSVECSGHAISADSVRNIKSESNISNKLNNLANENLDKAVSENGPVPILSNRSLPATTTTSLHQRTFSQLESMYSELIQARSNDYFENGISPFEKTVKENSNKENSDDKSDVLKSSLHPHRSSEVFIKGDSVERHQNTIHKRNDKIGCEKPININEIPKQNQKIEMVRLKDDKVNEPSMSQKRNEQEKAQNPNGSGNSPKPNEPDVRSEKQNQADKFPRPNWPDRPPKTIYLDRLQKTYDPNNAPQIQNDPDILQKENEQDKLCMQHNPDKSPKHNYSNKSIKSTERDKRQKANYEGHSCNRSSESNKFPKPYEFDKCLRVNQVDNSMGQASKNSKPFILSPNPKKQTRFQNEQAMIAKTDNKKDVHKPNHKSQDTQRVNIKHEARKSTLKKETNTTKKETELIKQKGQIDMKDVRPFQITTAIKDVFESSSTQDVSKDSFSMKYPSMSYEKTLFHNDSDNQNMHRAITSLEVSTEIESSQFLSNFKYDLPQSNACPAMCNSEVKEICMDDASSPAVSISLKEGNSPVDKETIHKRLTFTHDTQLEENEKNEKQTSSPEYLFPLEPNEKCIKNVFFSNGVRQPEIQQTRTPLSTQSPIFHSLSSSRRYNYNPYILSHYVKESENTEPISEHSSECAEEPVSSLASKSQFGETLASNESLYMETQEPCRVCIKPKHVKKRQSGSIEELVFVGNQRLSRPPSHSTSKDFQTRKMPRRCYGCNDQPKHREQPLPENSPFAPKFRRSFSNSKERCFQSPPGDRRYRFPKFYETPKAEQDNIGNTSSKGTIIVDKPKGDNSLPVEIKSGSPHKIVEEFKKSKVKPSQIPVDIYKFYPRDNLKGSKTKRKFESLSPTRTLTISGPLMNVNVPVFQHKVEGDGDENDRKDEDTKDPCKINQSNDMGKKPPPGNGIASKVTMKFRCSSPELKPKWKTVMEKFVPFGKKKSKHDESTVKLN